MATVEDLLRSDRTIRASAAKLGAALAAVEVFGEPALARSLQAEKNLYDQIEQEFGLLTAGEVGIRLGSASRAPRNLAATARRSGRLLAVHRGHQMRYPGFQFGSDGQPLPVIAELLAIASERGRSETGVAQWLCAPTTYLDGSRPVDLLRASPDRVVDVARRAWGIEW